MLDALLDAMFDPWPPFTFCCPQASRSGRRSFDSKLISLPPLDEVPVHVYRFAARVPCDSKGSECQCGIHRAEAASALRSRKTKRAAKEKPTPISQIFFSTDAAGGTPTRRHALDDLHTPHPPPNNLLLRMQRKHPTEPPASTQEVSESENRPATRGTAHSEVQGDDRGNERGNE